MIVRLLQALLIAWGALVLYYSNLPWPAGRLGLAISFALFAVCALWVFRNRKLRRAFVVAFLAVLTWYILIPPSNDRPWRAEVARPPRAVIDGDRVRFIDYRNFKYQSRHEFEEVFEEREVDISRMVSVDLLVSFWQVGPVGHTFLSFNFDDGSPPVSISIETRPEVGEGFNPLASMFKQVELIYVVGDERDLIHSRARHRNEEIFLYRLRASPEATRALFRVYLDRINSLADHPEWYHLLKNSCTINVIRYSRAAGGQHARIEIRHFLNGLIDGYLYRLGFLDTSFPFEELRRRSRITDVARDIGDERDFSAQIRRGLPGIPDLDP